MNGFISPDFKANQYSVLQNAGMIDMNVEKHFSLSSVHGNGKIYIDGSEHGSKVTCISDNIRPANGVAGCLRNYMRVQGYKTSYKDGSGILYTDIPPGKVLNFIKDLGMFTGFKEDVKESCVNEDWKSDFIKDNSYVNSKQYKNLIKELENTRNQHDDYWNRYKKEEEWLKKNGTIKPRSEWDEEDEYQSLLGNKPMSFKDEESASKHKEDKKVYLKKSLDLDHNISELLDKLELMKKEAREIEMRENKLSSKPKKSTKNKYKGFKMETGIPYYDERIKSGKGYIAEMSPKEYLLRCAFQVFSTGTIESTLGAVIYSKAVKYASKMKSGVDFDMPYLDFINGNQEGRHRAVAAMINGYKVIPVYVV